MALFAFYRTTVGKKVVMALTGLAMIGFLIGHMVGNLKIFGGVDPHTGLHVLDVYAKLLREFGSGLFGPQVLLWIARLGLIAAVVLHFMSAFQLARINRRARAADYANQQFRSANAASRTMLYGGVFLLLFIVFHILHFTTGTVHIHGFEHGHVFRNVMNAFANLWLVAFYVVAMAALAMHLYHGTWSMFQTLGVDSPSWNNGLRSVSKALAILLFLGFSAVPVASYLGLVPDQAPAVMVASR